MGFLCPSGLGIKSRCKGKARPGRLLEVYSHRRLFGCEQKVPQMKVWEQGQAEERAGTSPAHSISSLGLLERPTDRGLRTPGTDPLTVLQVGSWKSLWRLQRSPFLPLLNCAGVAGRPGAHSQVHDSDLCLRLHSILPGWLCVLSLLRGTLAAALGSTPLQYDLILTDYICKDPTCK